MKRHVRSEVVILLYFINQYQHSVYRR